MADTGKLPVLDGNGAVTHWYLDYWRESRLVVKIGAGCYPKGRAEYIRNQSFRIQNGHTGYGFNAMMQVAFISSRWLVANFNCRL